MQSEANSKNKMANKKREIGFFYKSDPLNQKSSEEAINKLLDLKTISDDEILYLVTYGAAQVKYGLKPTKEEILKDAREYLLRKDQGEDPRWFDLFASFTGQEIASGGLIQTARAVFERYFKKDRSK